MNLFSHQKQRRLVSCINRALLFCFVLGLTACNLAYSQLSPPGADHNEQAYPSGVVKIYVKDAGLYQISYADLINAGWRGDFTDPEKFRMIHRGSPINFWIEDSGMISSLRFYGEESSSLYSAESVYWLETINTTSEQGYQSDEVRPINSEDAPTKGMPDNAPENTYQEHIKFEENKLYLPQIESDDHWMWVDIPAPASRDLELELTGIAISSGWLHLSIWARTESPLEIDHHLRVHINGNLVADESWDGSGWYAINSEIPSGVLQDGVNRLSIEAPGDTGVAADLIYLDRVEVTYSRFPQVKNDLIMWESTGEKLVFEGFSDPYRVYDITDPIRGFLEAEGIEPSHEFTGAPGRRYIAISDAGVMKPTRLEPASLTPDLLDAANEADYLAIGPKDLLEPLEPLLSLRANEGLRVKAVELEAVYDQFAHGYPEPVAIQRLMHHAHRHWKLAPKFLLLVGDGSYDPRGFIAPPQANRLPTFLVQTVFGGETASDVGFVQLNDDPWPDIAIGRLPARSADQIQAIVEKTLSYEQALASGETNPGIVAIADGQSPSFRDEAQRFLDLFPDQVTVELYSPEAGIAEANQVVKKYFEGENRW